MARCRLSPQPSAAAHKSELRQTLKAHSGATGNKSYWSNGQAKANKQNCASV